MGQAVFPRCAACSASRLYNRAVEKELGLKIFIISSATSSFD